MTMKSIFNIGDFVQTPRGFFMVVDIQIDAYGDVIVSLMGKEDIDDYSIEESKLQKDILRHIQHKNGRASVNFFELAFAK